MLFNKEYRMLKTYRRFLSKRTYKGLSQGEDALFLLRPTTLGSRLSTVVLYMDYRFILIVSFGLVVNLIIS